MGGLVHWELAGNPWTIVESLYLRSSWREVRALLPPSVTPMPLRSAFQALVLASRNRPIITIASELYTFCR